MSVVTRFAPSPSGSLHIGGARTALFNWLFARHHELYGNGGKYLLRIEDTDRAVSVEGATKQIYESLEWLGLDWDGEAVSQFARVERHREIASQLVNAGLAYNCYCTPAELSEMRELARNEGRPMRYDRRWRDREPSDTPSDVAPAIRFKMPLEGVSVINDLVQGKIEVSNKELDDLVLLRADGTPTYMLASVVDDHDMGVTHIIRGDDHLTNAFRQSQICRALDWNLPEYAHIPLIYGQDGAKLSKRHGAVGVESYKQLGFLPEALCNYLLRLGWGHGNEEIIDRNQAIKWFGLEAVGKSPSRFDISKLASINAHYLRNADDKRLVNIVMREIREKFNETVVDCAKDRILRGMPGLKGRSKSIIELTENSMFYVFKRPIKISRDAAELLTSEAKCFLREFANILENSDWSKAALEVKARTIADQSNIKLGALAQPLRAAITGKTISPSIFEVMEILGPEETQARLEDVLCDN